MLTMMPSEEQTSYSLINTYKYSRDDEKVSNDICESILLLKSLKKIKVK